MSQGEQYAPPGSQYAETEAEARARLGRALRECGHANGAKYDAQSTALTSPGPFSWSAWGRTN